MNLVVHSRKEELAELCRRFKVRRLALFGSSLTTQFDEAASDLDFLVEFQPAATAEYSRNYFGLLGGLETLFGRRVDLVEAQAVRNPYVQREIAPTQEILYAT